MAIDSNAMCDLSGNILPQFTPWPSPQSSGVNLFSRFCTTCFDYAVSICFSTNVTCWSCAGFFEGPSAILYICCYGCIPTTILVAITPIACPEILKTCMSRLSSPLSPFQRGLGPTCRNPSRFMGVCFEIVLALYSAMSNLYDLIVSETLYMLII